MIIRGNKRKLFSSALTFEEIRLLSHEIAKKVISGKLTKEEAINEVMDKANWSYGYADAAVSSWIENEPTYNGMVMSSFTLHYKNDNGDDSVWGIYDTKEEAESEIERFRTTGFGPNPTFCEIIESSRKSIKSNAKDDEHSYEINRENKATLSWGDFCDSLSEDFVMDGIFRTVPGDHHWSEVIGDLVVVLFVSEDNPSQGRFSIYKRGNFKKPLRTEYKRFNNADEAKELMHQFIEFSEKFDENHINSSRKPIKSSTYQFVCEFDGKYEPRVISHIGDQGVIWEDADENYDNAVSFSESELPEAVRSIVKNEDDFDNIEIVKDNGDSVFIKEFIREGSFDKAWEKAVKEDESY